MPSIGVFVARSFSRATWQQAYAVFDRTNGPDLARRDVLVDAADRVYSIKTALSSWDNCMSANFCKWPVIAIIVVGSLIIFSIVWCIIRRLCCAMACCCSCFSCLKCCGNCCGCCTPPGQKNHKYLEEPYIPPNHGYQSQAPMHASPAIYNPPQYAEFDVSRKGGADSLPEMPSWESGSSKKVKLDDDVEMDHLNQPSTGVSGLAAVSPEHTSPGAFSPIGAPNGSPSSYVSGRPLLTHNGYGQLPPPSSRQHTGVSSPTGQPGYHDYHSSPDPNRYDSEQPYPGYAPPGPAALQMGQGFAAEPSYPEQQQPFGGPPAGYGVSRQGTGSSAGRMGSRTAYGPDPRSRASPGPRNTPKPQGDYQYMASARATPAPRETGYRRPSYGPAEYPAANYGHDEAQYSPPTSWQSQDRAQVPAPQSPITNSGGFDFISGYARPPTRGHDERRTGEDAQPPTQEAYPGYKPYQPA